MIGDWDRMRVDAPYRAMLGEAGLSSVPAVARLIGDRIAAWSRSSDTVYVSLPRSNSAVYVKRYHYVTWKRRLRAALRGGRPARSRARREYGVLRAMRRLGIQAVRPIAWGERRRWGLVRTCFLITEAVPEAMSLATFLQRYAEPPSALHGEREAGGSSAWHDRAVRVRRTILTILARQIGHMHDAGFVHRDLFWRNVLIRALPNEEFEFYFLDASVSRRIRWRRFRQEAIVRDLAALAVLAPAFCSRADQLRFIREYLGTDHLREEERQLLGLVAERSIRYRASEELRMARQTVFDRLQPDAEPDAARRGRLIEAR